MDISEAIQELERQTAAAVRHAIDNELRLEAIRRECTVEDLEAEGYHVAQNHNGHYQLQSPDGSSVGPEIVIQVNM